MNNIIFVIISLLVLIYIIYSVKKSKLSIAESFYWFLSAILMLILSIFPKSIDNISLKLGVSYPPSLLFTICIVFLILMLFRCSKKIADQNDKIKYLIQEVSILKGNNNDKK